MQYDFVHEGTFSLSNGSIRSHHCRLERSLMGWSPCCVSISNRPCPQNPHKCQPRQEGLPVSQHSEHNSGVPRTSQLATLGEIASLQLQVKANTSIPYPLPFHMHVSSRPCPHASMYTQMHGYISHTQTTHIHKKKNHSRCLSLFIFQEEWLSDLCPPYVLNAYLCMCMRRHFLFPHIYS